MREEQKRQKEMQKRINNVEDALKEALEKNKLKLTTILDFPKYRQLPTSLQFALALMEEKGGIIVRKYELLKKTKEKKLIKKENKNGKK